MRLQKDFRFGKAVRLGVFVDGLNLLNDESPETVQSSLVTADNFNYPPGRRSHDNAPAARTAPCRRVILLGGGLS